MDDDDGERFAGPLSRTQRELIRQWRSREPTPRPVPVLRAVPPPAPKPKLARVVPGAMVPAQRERSTMAERIFDEVAVHVIGVDPRAPGRIRARRALCAWCDQHLMLREATIDHVIPRAQGGTNARQNLVLACYPCNLRKGDSNPYAWRAWLTTPEGKAWRATPWRDRLRWSGTPPWLAFILPHRA